MKIKQHIRIDNKYNKVVQLIHRDKRKGKLEKPSEQKKNNNTNDTYEVIISCCINFIASSASSFS